MIAGEEAISEQETEVVARVSGGVDGFEGHAADPDGIPISQPDVGDEVRSFLVAVDGDGEAPGERIRQRGVIRVGVCNDDADGGSPSDGLQDGLQV